MEDQQSFFNFLRMPPEMFGDELLNKVGPRIRRVDLWVACFNEKISTEVRIFGGIIFRRNGRNCSPLKHKYYMTDLIRNITWGFRVAQS